MKVDKSEACFEITDPVLHQGVTGYFRDQHALFAIYLVVRREMAVSFLVKRASLKVAVSHHVYTGETTTKSIIFHETNLLLLSGMS